MCLPDFERFEYINEAESLTGLRNWRFEEEGHALVSEYISHFWKVIEGPHEVKEKDSGIYSYSNFYKKSYNNFYNNYSDSFYNYNRGSYCNYNYNNNYYNYYYNYSHYSNYYLYIISGIISLWGKVAIHKNGYRSEYAKIKTLFTIREEDATGSKEFLNWIKKFNKRMIEIAKIFECDTISWQDFEKSQIIINMSGDGL